MRESTFPRLAFVLILCRQRNDREPHAEAGSFAGFIHLL
jgi:hypothetical protein